MDPNFKFRFSVRPVPDGEALTFAEIEERYLKQLEESERKLVQSLTELAKLYSQATLHDEACRCIERLIALSNDPEQHGSYYLSLGCFMEKIGDYKGAAKFYGQALALEPCRTSTWYYIHNNLGFSLNQLEDYDAAIPYLRRAIEIDPGLPNAYKNLGLALEAKGSYCEAAELFITATQTDAADSRSLGHLENLISSHPELEIDVPDLLGRLESCREAVAIARAQQPDLRGAWDRARQRQRRD
jgi:tetratricopeptide (TPR) repeat protein